MLNLTNKELNRRYEVLDEYPYDSFYDMELNDKIDDCAQWGFEYEKAYFALKAYEALLKSKDNATDIESNKIYYLKMLKHKLHDVHVHLSNHIELEIKKMAIDSELHDSIDEQK